MADNFQGLLDTLFLTRQSPITGLLSKEEQERLNTQQLLGFDVKRNTSSLVQTVTKSFENSSVYFEQVLTVVFYKYDEDKRNILQALSQNDQLQIIAIDQNDVQYMVGQVNGAYLSGGDANSGTALGDGNKLTFIFTGQEPTPARVISGALGTVFTGATIVN